MSRCTLVVKRPRFVQPQLFSRTEWNVRWLIGFWQELPLINMILTFGFDCLTFLRPRWRRRFTLISLVVGFRVVLKNVVYTFHRPKSLVIIFQTMSFIISNWLTIIQTRNQQLPYTTCLTCSTLKAFPPGVIFHPFVPLLEPPVPLKNMWTLHGVISLDLLKHFKCLRRSFPLLE